MSGRSTGQPRFDVWPTPVASEDLKALEGNVDQAAGGLRRQLSRSGCRAAHYRLSGIDVDRICVVVLPREYRMLIAFPAPDEVTVLLAGPHDRLNSQVDVYARLYRALGIEVPEAERRKPPCCEDGQPPVDSNLVDRFIARSVELAKEGRRRRRWGGG